jgi:hypothetical protein
VLNLINTSRLRHGSGALAKIYAPICAGKEDSVLFSYTARHLPPQNSGDVSKTKHSVLAANFSASLRHSATDMRDPWTVLGIQPETHIAPLHCGGILTETAAAITLNLGSRKQTRLTNSCWRILRIEEILQPKVPGENSTTQDIRRAPDIETAIVILHPLAFTHESLESPKAGTLPVDDQTWDTSFRKVEGLPSECFVPRLPSALRSVASISFGTL